MTEYLMQAYEVSSEIKSSSEYLEMKKKLEYIKINYKELIDDFNKAKEKYYLVLDEGGKYHPDYFSSIKNLSTAKKALYEKNEVIAYFKLEQSIQKRLSEFTIQITEIISNHIKKPNELGLLKEKDGGCHASK